jgi:HEAT repeat protein
VVCRAHALAALDRPEGMAALRKGLASDDEHAQILAARAIGDLGPKAAAAVDDLLPLLKNDHPLVRQMAAYALSACGRPAAGLPPLVDSLQDPNPLIRRFAAQLLEKLGPAARPAVAALNLARRDDDEEVRDFATRAMRRIQSR